jgi:hypothetical protein
MPWRMKSAPSTLMRTLSGGGEHFFGSIVSCLWSDEGLKHCCAIISTYAIDFAVVELGFSGAWLFRASLLASHKCHKKVTTSTIASSSVVLMRNQWDGIWSTRDHVCSINWTLKEILTNCYTSWAYVDKSRGKTSITRPYWSSLGRQSCTNLQRWTFILFSSLIFYIAFHDASSSPYREAKPLPRALPGCVSERNWKTRPCLGWLNCIYTTLSMWPTYKIFPTVSANWHLDDFGFCLWIK